MSEDEILKQQSFDWARGAVYESYNRYLGQYQVQACLEHAKGGSLLDMPCGDGALTEMFVPISSGSSVLMHPPNILAKRKSVCLM